MCGSGMTGSRRTRISGYTTPSGWFSLSSPSCRACDRVHVWLRDEGIALPVTCHNAGEGRGITWRLPLYNTVHNILTNPVYAGAYAFGRTMSKVSVEDGRKRINRG